MRNLAINLIGGLFLFALIAFGMIFLTGKFTTQKAQTQETTPKSTETKKVIEEQADPQDPKVLQEAYERGRREAEADVRNGRFVIHFAGIAVPGKVFKEKMLKHYGVEVVTGGCTMTYEESERMKGYDEVSRAAVEKKFGKGVIESELKESKKL